MGHPVCEGSCFRGWRSDSSNKGGDVERYLPVKSTDFREHMARAVNFIVNYLGTLRDRPLGTEKEPGFLYKKLPREAPQHPETFGTIMDEFETKLVPNLAHW